MLKERQRGKIDKGTQKCHSVPWRHSSEDLFYLFILKNSKQETFLALKAAREICYWSCEETAFMIADDIEYGLLGGWGLLLQSCL